MDKIWKDYNKLEKAAYKTKIKAKPKKRKILTPATKLFIWENQPHNCHICGKKIKKQSDVEFDHVKAFSKGGTKMKLSHHFCNKLKSNKSLKITRKTLGIKTTKKTPVKKKITRKK